MHILPTSIYETSLLLSYAFTETFYRPSFSQHYDISGKLRCGHPL